MVRDKWRIRYKCITELREENEIPLDMQCKDKIQKIKVTICWDPKPRGRQE